MVELTIILYFVLNHVLLELTQLFLLVFIVLHLSVVEETTTLFTLFCFLLFFLMSREVLVGKNK